MKYVILSSKISGIKNISRDIEIQYTNKMPGYVDADHCQIKCIYGPNGSGKSGICHAYDIYQKVLMQESALKDSLFASSLVKLINMSTKSFSIENRFIAQFDDGTFIGYCHAITISIADGQPIVSEERLSPLDFRGNESRPLVHIKDGSFLANTVPGFGKEDLPFLRFGSFIPYLALSKANEKRTQRDIIAEQITFLFARSLAVKFGSNADAHDSLFLDQYDQVKNREDFEKLNLSQSTWAQMFSARTGYYWFGLTEQETELIDRVKKMVPFLQTINDALVDVEPIFKRDGERSYATLEFHYKDHIVELEFESTGIRKAVGLFDALYHIGKGGIAIIDEIDAGLHDVFLTKLIEFFALYGRGQIIMTTHNVGLMSFLKSSRQIGFLGYDNVFVPWRQRGVSSAAKAYLSGAIEHLPFNLKAADFGAVFYGEDEDG